MDIERDKVRIITNVLNHGTKEAVDWLFDTYAVKETSRQCLSTRSQVNGIRNRSTCGVLFL